MRDLFYKIWLIIVVMIASASFTIALFTAARAAEPICGTKAESEAFAKKMDATRIAMAIRGNGNALWEVYTTPDGGWFLVQTEAKPDAPSCIVAGGPAFELLEDLGEAL